jgi:phosphonate transport system substrate-binding protein
VTGIATRHKLSRRAALAGIAAAIFAPAVHARSKPVLFGLTPVFLDSDIRLTAQIESYLSEKLARPVQLIKRRTYMEITSLLLADQLDAAWICGLPFVQHRSQLQLIAVPVYRGAPKYRAYLITNASEESNDPLSTRGKIHVFSDPDSNSGHLVTSAWLSELNETPTTFFSKFFFAYGHRNVIRAVGSGLAHSGSVDGYVWEVMQEVEPALIERTKVLRRSPEMGFPPIAASRIADKEVTQAISKAMVEMPEDPVGRNILSILRLDGFSAETPELFDSIAASWLRVRRDG